MTDLLHPIPIETDTHPSEPSQDDSFDFAPSNALDELTAQVTKAVEEGSEAGDHHEQDDDADSMQDEDGDLCDDDAHTGLTKPIVGFKLALPVESEPTMITRRQSCIATGTTAAAGVSFAVTDTATTKSTKTGTAGRVKKSTIKSGVNHKKSSGLSDARPLRGQSMYHAPTKSVLSKSVSTTNLPPSGLLNKPMGFGAAGTTSLSTFVPPPTQPMTARTQSRPNTSASANGECLTARGSSSNKENVMELANGAQTSRTKVSVQSRHMVVNYSHKTKNVATIEKSVPTLKQQNSVARRSSLTDTLPAVINPNATRLGAAASAGKRRSAEMTAQEEPANKKAKISPVEAVKSFAFDTTPANEVRQLDFTDVNMQSTESAAAPVVSISPSETIMRMTNERFQLMGKIESLEKQIQEKDAQLAQQQTPAPVDQSAITELESQLEEKSETITEQEATIARLRQEANDYSDVCSQLNEANTKLFKLQEEMFEMKKTVQEAKKMEQAASGLVSAKFFLHREVTFLKTFLSVDQLKKVQEWELQEQRRPAAAPTTTSTITTTRSSAASNTASNGGWTSGESMVFDSSNSLLDGRRATMAVTSRR